jgi:membrane protease subunit (stomatin/prohibitin family)
MAIIDRVKFDGPGAWCEACKIDAAPNQLACPRCKKTFIQRPWLVYKFPSEELVMGTQVIVNSSQEVIFYKDGAALDLLGAGRHTLSTNNIPVLLKLVNIPFGGKTPFAAEIYYINKTSRLDMKWGTVDPFQIMDPKFGILLGIRAFGRFGITVSDSRKFVTGIVGVLPGSGISDYTLLSEYFKGLVVTKVKDTIAGLIVKNKVSALDIVAQIDSISNTCKERVSEEFSRFGLNIENFFVESINFPDEDIAKLKSYLEQSAEFNVLGDERYNRKRSLDVLEKLAGQQGGGIAAAGMGLGIGVGAGVSVGSTVGAAMGNVAGQMNVGMNTTEKGTITCPECKMAQLPGAKFCNNCGKSLLAQGTQCPKCKTVNTSEAKFCLNCGAVLKQGVKCSSCSFENTGESKFCTNCGTKLS